MSFMDHFNPDMLDGNSMIDLSSIFSELGYDSDQMFENSYTNYLDVDVKPFFEPGLLHRYIDLRVPWDKQYHLALIPDNVYHVKGGPHITRGSITVGDGMVIMSSNYTDEEINESPSIINIFKLMVTQSMIISMRMRLDHFSMYKESTQLASKEMMRRELGHNSLIHKGLVVDEITGGDVDIRKYYEYKG